MSTIGSVYNLGRVTQLASPHQDTHTHIFPPRLSVATTFTTPVVRPRHVHPSIDFIVSSLSQDFTKLTQTLVLPHSMPHTDLHSDFPKLSLCIPLLATCLPCLHNSVFFSSLPQTFLSCLTFSLCLLVSFLPSLVVHPCALIWTPNVTFVNRCVLWVCHAPSWTNVPK
jgi:hypothetical protein